MMGELEGRFADFMSASVPQNPLKAEYYLPAVANALLVEGKAEIKVLPTEEKWYGVTYAGDMEKVRAAISAMRGAGKYPNLLWEN
jgi:hypothetical protein